MIVTDLDGTLLAGGSELPEENLRALRRAMDAGVQVVIASGRMIEATTPIADQIGVNAPMVLFNGAMVYDGRENRILHGSIIPRETAVALLKEIEARGIYVHAYPGHGFYLQKRSRWTDYYEERIKVNGIEVGGKLSEWLASDVYKLLCIGEPSELEALRAVLLPMFPQVGFVKSSENLMEIVAKGVDKATGLAALGEIAGVAPGEMLAFGDEMNDLGMLQYAGEGYAMENAVEGVRRVIPRIAPRNTEFGVAQIVNHYLDEGRMGRS